MATAPRLGALLSAGFALMALVPILLALFLLERRGGGVVGLPGAVVLLMLLSALSGFALIRRELGRLVIQLVRTASREAGSGLSERIREASEDEIAKISTTIEAMTSRLREPAAATTSPARLEKGIARVAHAAQVARGVRQLRALLTDGVLESLGGRCAYFVGLDEDAGDFVTCAASGAEDVVSAALAWRIPLGEGIPGRCARERRAMVLAQGEIPAGGPSFGAPTHAVVAAPLLQGETLHGVLVADAGPDDRRYGDDDAAALAGYATTAAAALGAATERERLERGLGDVLGGLIGAIEARDPYARGHAARVARYCDGMARALRLDDDTRRTLRLAALVHDVGKLGLPDSVLRKEGRLTPEELELMRTHVSAGEKILRGIPALAPLAPLVRHHHERSDGSGYPDGLKGDAIPLPTHVLIVANAFDIMTSDRAYRKASSLPDALQAIRAKAGTWYDRRAVGALLGLDSGILRATDDSTGSGATVRGRATASVSVRE